MQIPITHAPSTHSSRFPACARACQPRADPRRGDQRVARASRRCGSAIRGRATRVCRLGCSLRRCAGCRVERQCRARGTASRAFPWRSPCAAVPRLQRGRGRCRAGVGFYIFDDVGTRRVEGDAGYTRAGNVAYLAGSATGATLGAHIVGRMMGGQSPLWATAAGAVVGTLPLFLAACAD